MKKRIIGALITIVVIATVVFIYKGEKFESTTLIAGKSENRLEAAILSEVDISKNGDGSVMATLSSDQKTLTITGNGKMKDFDNKDNKAPWNKYLGRITTVDIQEGVQNIGAYAFIWQTSCNLSNLNLPNSITEIGEEAFEQCTGITNLNLPNNLKKIDSYAFSRCRGIDTINLKNVEEIGDCAFFMCSNLETVEITDKTTTIGEAVFRECPNLKSITVDSENTNYCSVDGILFNKDKTELLRYPPQKLDSTTYSIPTTVTKIGATAFEDCSTITNIEIPNGVTEIEGWAFDRCSSLSSFTIPNGVTTIKTNTFYGCKSFTSFEIPSNVTKFEGNWIFHGCSNLNKLTVNSYFSGVGLDTFYGCDKLETLVITEKAESINSFIFESIDALKKIEIDNNNRCLKTDANGEILYNYEITKVIGCIQLKEGKIILPKTITEIEGGAFQSCSLITSLEIPLKVTSIGSSAFNGMNVATIYLPKNVKLGSYNGSGENKTIYCHSSAFAFSALRVEDDDAPIVNIDKNNGFTINATDSESGLSSYNEYEYYISSSKTALANGTWTKYNLGEKFNITENEGNTYVFVKPISDKIGNTYETDSVEIDGETYNLIYEKVVEEETAPILTTEKVNNVVIEKTTNTSKPANNTVDTTVANKILPKTGIVTMLSISFVVLIIISIVLYKKIKEYSDVK